MVEKENAEPHVVALHEMVEELHAETLIDIVAKVKANGLVDTLTDWPIEVGPKTLSEHSPIWRPKQLSML